MHIIIETFHPGKEGPLIDGKLHISFLKKNIEFKRLHFSFIQNLLIGQKLPINKGLISELRTLTKEIPTYKSKGRSLSPEEEFLNNIEGKTK